MKKYISYSSMIPVLLLFFFGSCKKEYTDPSGPSSSQAFSSPNALTDVAVGLQNWYTAGRGGSVYNRVTASGLLTNELYVVNAGNTDEAQLGTGGGAVQNTNGIGTGMWSVSNKIIYDANKILANVDQVVSDKNYASGLVAYASIFKALAIGDMAMFWENIPAGIADTLGKEHVNFISSVDGYKMAVSVLDNALNTIASNGVSTAFLNNIPKVGTSPVYTVDLQNTLYALKARYALFAGDYTTALEAANQVDLTARSVFVYNSVTTNPIYTLATSTNNIYQPIDSTMGLPSGLQPDPNDKREPFYIAINTSILPRYRIGGFYTGTTTAIPVYLPGEIMLIKAECYARQNDLINGLDQLNLVVTKQPSADPFGVGAALPPTTATDQDDLLTQIYKHRCIELFMSGLKLEDERRFGRATSERKRSYLPYPFVERNDNPNTPADPAF